MSAEIEMYTGPRCIYCDRAKKLLNQKGLVFKELDINQNPKLKDEMVIRTGGKKTIPQIFINKKSIGGFDELYSLELIGDLDKILGT
tara:strand:- start:336 stop:596 length:261 start_codon:yes stop_codon:yes gene_type:complete